MSGLAEYTYRWCMQWPSLAEHQCLRRKRLYSVCHSSVFKRKGVDSYGGLWGTLLLLV